MSLHSSSSDDNDDFYDYQDEILRTPIVEHTPSEYSGRRDFVDSHSHSHSPSASNQNHLSSSPYHQNPGYAYRQRGSTKSNHSGSSGSPASTSRAPSFENTKQAFAGSSLDTVSIGSVGGLSVPPSNYDARSYDGLSLHSTPRHDRPHSLRGIGDRSPLPLRRGGSPTSSVISDREREDIEQINVEEVEKRRRIQIYVFVLRCIAFPFNAKQKPPQHDMQKRQAKISKQELTKIKENFHAFLSGEMQIMADEAFKNAVQSYYEVFLKSERVTSMVRSGACSANDFREVFKNNIEKRVRCLPEIDGLAKETVLSNWMTKFDLIYRGNDGDQRSQRTSTTTNELILSKEQLYEMFQNIFNIKNYDHLILFNALQLDNPDEQAAQVRRELTSRQQQIDSGGFKMKPWKPRFIVKEMEPINIDELNTQILQLKSNLESVPVKGGTIPKHTKKPSRQSNTLPKIDVAEEGDQHLSKMDVVLSFGIEVKIIDLKGLKMPGNKNIYCTMEMDGLKLQTGLTPVSKPFWSTQGDFTTTQPLPNIKIKLYMENSSIISIDDKELAKITLKPTATSSKNAQLYTLTTTDKKIQEQLQLRVEVKMEKPQNMKYCGYLYAAGKKIWRTLKKRYFVLVQVSQYTFTVCSYRERKTEPTEMLHLKGFTVDYSEAHPDMDCNGAQYYFNAVKEGDSVTFATDDMYERYNWVQALCRATGQSHKPTPPVITTTANGGNTPNLPNLPKGQGEIDRARKHGLDEYVSADPCEFNHAELFQSLQSLTLEYRMNDAYTCLGWFSPGQSFILDEYAARYCVRGCHRYLSYMSDLLDKAENGLMIDPNIIHYSFAFCAAHVHGNKPDGLGTITVAEKQKFDEIKSRLRALLEHQITHFRYCFPFGRPDGALKSTLSLLEKVLMKELTSNMSVEEVRSVITKCLKDAALVNYTRISEFAKIEANVDARDETVFNIEQMPTLQYSHLISQAAHKDPADRLEDIIHLAGLCIEVLQQNEEHHAEAFTWFADVLLEHNEMFWSLFTVDMDACLETQHPENWEIFSLFSLLNSYLLTDKNLVHGEFHKHLKDIFAPQVVRYVDLMQSSIAQSVHKGFTSKEKWEPKGAGCVTSDDVLWKLDALQTFIKELQWPDDVFAEHLEGRLKLMASDMMEAMGNRTISAFGSMLSRCSKGLDFVVPSEICVMVNTLSDCKAQALKLCIMAGESTHRYHIHIEEYLESAIKHILDSLLERFLLVLDITLQKLKRYDEGSFLKSILTLTKPTNELGQEYIIFVFGNMDMICNKITDDGYFGNTLLEMWYGQQVDIIHKWLAERVEMTLHPYQLTCLIHIIKRLRHDFELQGTLCEEISNSAYDAICKRLSVEETSQAVNESRPARTLASLSVDLDT